MGLQHEDCWTLSSFNTIVDTFQSLEISLERRAFGYITHPSSDRSVRVLAREDSWLKRNVREAIEIKIGQPAMNRDQGYELSPSTMNFCCHVIAAKTIT